MRVFRFTARAALLAASLAPGMALASSSDAWDEFRVKVRAACLKAAAPQIPTGKAVVDPFGSESYGLAVVTGTPKGGSKAAMLICVYDKTSGKAEIGSELPLPR
ncbi:hypothetical protein [Aquabacter cavernae]|uniref:hypothetical protein n=1 Tax=Aquabacter cavernae TaxID=2496029 RepID=UPI0030840DFA